METDDNADLQARPDGSVAGVEASPPESAESPDSGSTRLDPSIIEQIIDGDLPLKEDAAEESVPPPAEEVPDEKPDDSERDDTEDDTEAETKPLPKNFRLKTENREDALALSIFRAARGTLSLQEAAAIAHKQSVSPEPPPRQEETPAADRPLSAHSVAELSAMALDVESKYLQAHAELDPSAAELSIQLARIIDAKNEARYREAEEARAAKAQEASAAQQFESEWNSHRDKALALYPDAGKEGSDLFNRIREIHEVMVANGDPTVNDVRQPLILSQMAARDLGIAPASGRPAGSQSPAVRPEAVKAAVPVRPRPVSGGAPTGSATPTINIREMVRSTDDLEALTEKFLRMA